MKYFVTRSRSNGGHFSLSHVRGEILKRLFVITLIA